MEVIVTQKNIFRLRHEEIIYFFLKKGDGLVLHVLWWIAGRL
jgi:hypothetical protein